MQNNIGWSGNEPDLAGLTPEQRDAYEKRIETRQKVESASASQSASQVR